MFRSVRLCVCVSGWVVGVRGMMKMGFDLMIYNY